MTDHVGLNPVPDDAKLEDWLEELLEAANKEKESLLEEFVDVVQYGKNEGEPYLFAYARLLNHLASLDHPLLIHILSAAIWEIMEAETYGS